MGGAGAPSLDAAVAEFRTWLVVERGLAPNSVAASLRDLRRYVAFLDARGVRDVDRVTEADVAAYAADLATAVDDEGRPRYAPASIARAVVSVRALHRFARDEELAATDPTGFFRREHGASGTQPAPGGHRSREN